MLARDKVKATSTFTDVFIALQLTSIHPSYSWRMVAHLKVKDLLGVACLLSNAAASSDGVSLNPCQVWRSVEGLEWVLSHFLTINIFT